MKLTLSVVADVVMDEEALRDMLAGMSLDELYYLGTMCYDIARAKRMAAAS